MIGIIGAMDIEVQKLKELLTDTKNEKISGVDFVSGKLGNAEVVVAKCGIGKVFAAICAEAMIMRYKPEIVINIGVAGGLSDKLKIGDIVIADSVAQHDMDTTALGEEPGFLSEIKLVKIPADKKAVETLKNACDTLSLSYEAGTIASGDQFVSDFETKKRIQDTFSAKACEMEGASIGQVCYVNNVPFGTLRAISDGANDNAKLDFPTFAALAAENSVKVIKIFIDTFKR